METPFVMDLHTHTIVSGHAFGTIREMAQAAAENGLQVLGFAEHAPGIPGTTDPIYYLSVGLAPREYQGVTLLYSSEVNVLNDGTLSLPDKYMKRLDYVIAGIHTYCYTDAGREKNTDNLISCMAHPRVRFVSHPDDDHTPLNYERLVLAAKEHHVALEVNDSSLKKGRVSRLNARENYRTMLALCKEHRVPVIVNSDAHDPTRVGAFFNARPVLEEAEFDEELILNTSVEKLMKFLGVETFER